MICSRVKLLAGAASAAEQASRAARKTRKVILDCYTLKRRTSQKLVLTHAQLFKRPGCAADREDDCAGISRDRRKISGEVCADCAAPKLALHLRGIERRGGTDGAGAGGAWTGREGPDWCVVHQLCRMDSAAFGVHANWRGAGECKSVVSSLRVGFCAAEVGDEGALFVGAG